MSASNQKINVAIDGPAGAGKSTVARRLAARLEYIYVDTGAMYRAITWKCIEKQLQPSQVEAIMRLARSLNIELVPNENTVLVDGQDVTEEIREHAVSQAVSSYAQLQQLRSLLVKKQQNMAARKGVVMDGRDIGSHVLPSAELKIYLTASAKTRAERRHAELLKKGNVEITIDELLKDIEKRDSMDRQRTFSPLLIPEDAIVLDSSNLTIEEVINKMFALSMEKINAL